MLIYKITNLITNKIYIGQTTKTINERLNGHFDRAFYGKSKTKIHNSMRKHGKENFKIEIIQKCHSLTELNFYEKFWIKYYNSNIDGYNVTCGGQQYTKPKSKTKYIMSEERKKKIAIANKGKNNGMYGKRPDYLMSSDEKVEYRKKISNSLKQSEKFQKSRKSKEFRKKISDIQSKPLYVLDINFNIIDEFKNCRYISEKYKCTIGNVKNARRDKRKILKKYWVLYVEDYNKNKYKLREFFNEK